MTRVPPDSLASSTAASGAPLRPLLDRLFYGLLAGFVAILLLRLVVFPDSGAGRGSLLVSALLLSGAVAFLLSGKPSVARPQRLARTLSWLMPVGGGFLLYAVWQIGLFPYWVLLLFAGALALWVAQVEIAGRAGAGRLALAGALLYIALAGALALFGPGDGGRDPFAVLRGSFPLVCVLFAWTTALGDAAQGRPAAQIRERIVRRALAQPLAVFILIGVLFKLLLPGQVPVAPTAAMVFGVVFALAVLLIMESSPRLRPWLPRITLLMVLLWMGVAWAHLSAYFHLLMPFMVVAFSLLLPYRQRFLALALSALAIGLVFAVPDEVALAPRVTHALAAAWLLALSLAISRQLEALSEPAGATVVPARAGSLDTEQTARRVGVSVALLLLLAGATGVSLFHDDRFERQSVDTLDVACEGLHDFLALLERNEQLARALSRRQLSQRLDISAFQDLARDLTVFAGPGITLQWAPGGVVRFNAPESGNEASIGHDLLADPERRPAILELMESRQGHWSGPVTLRQGGFGLFYRMPIFAPGASGQFLGLSAALMRFPEVLGAMLGSGQYRFRVRVGPAGAALQTVWESPGWRNQADGATQSVFIGAGLPDNRRLRPSQMPVASLDVNRDLSIEFSAQPGAPFSALSNMQLLQVLFILAVLLGGAARALTAAYLNRQAARLAEEERDNLASTIEHSALGVIVFAADGRVVVHNQNALKVFGLTPDQLARLNPWQSPVWQKEGWTETARQALATGVSQTFNYFGRGSFGQSVEARVTLSRIYLAGLPHFIFQGIDLSEINALRIEREISARENELILAHTGAGLVKLVEREIRWVNPAFCKLFLRAERELLNQSIRIIYPDQASFEAVGRAAYPVIREGGGYSHERKLLRADGSTFWAHLSGQQILDDDSGQGSIWIVEDISERKQAEELLLEVNENLELEVSERTRDLAAARDFSESLIERMDSIFLLMTLEGRALRLNALGRQLSGRSLDDLDGESAWEALMPAADRTAATAILERLVKTRVPVYFEGTWLAAGGGTYSIGWNLSLTYNAAGEPDYVMAVGQNITEEKALAYELELYRQNLESKVEQRTAELLGAQRSLRNNLNALDAVGIGILWVAAGDGRLLYANASAARRLGYEGDELLTLTIDQLLPPAQAADYLAARLPEGEVRAAETLIHHDGRTLATDSWRFAVAASEAAPAHFVVFHIDLSERRELEQTNARLRQLLDRSPDLIAIARFNEEVLFINDGGRDLLGIPADENVSELLLGDIHTGEARRVLREEKLPGLLVDGVWHGENTLSTRRGESVPVAVNAFVLPGIDGAADYLGLIMHDLRLIKAKKDELRAARDAADEANAAKSRFLATMSHELRTPLNGILGMAQLLQTREVAPESRIESARTIVKSGNALLTLLNDILDFAKIEAGYVRLEPAVFNPARLMEEVSWLFSTPARGKQIEFKVRWHGPGEAYVADHHRVRQMLNNFVSNALKFSENGLVEISGRETVNAAGERLLEFSVRDHGIGLSQTEQDRLFEAFRQADEGISRKYGGTGLGLSIVRALAEAMGGTVGVESAPGEGARFWFSLRADLPEATDIAEAVDDDDWAVQTLSGRVLMADDDETNRKVASDFLENLGLHWSAVSNGREAVDVWRQFGPFDLVLMDLHMPVLDGFDATSEIRALQGDDGKAVPILAMTADHLPATRERCRALGFSGFVDKPVRLRQLGAILSRYLPEATVVVGTRPDAGQIAGLLALLDELDPMLAQRRFQSVDVVQKMAAVADGSELSSDVAAMVTQARSMKFEPLKAMSSALRQRLGEYGDE